MTQIAPSSVTIGPQIAGPILFVFFISACGPEPGTPEYVLNEIRQGKVVGGANLQLLGAAELDRMLEMLADPKSPRMARLQLVERVTRMELEDPVPKLAGLLAHPDPEVRIVVTSWLGSQKKNSVVTTLIDALKKEKELAVEANLVNALVRLGTEIEKPPAQTIDRLLKELEEAPGPRKKIWARILSGWRGERVIQALSSQLASEDTDLAVASATALVGPLQRPIEVLVPVATGMLDHPVSRVRAAGLGGLLASTFPGRVSGLAACTEKPTLALLATAHDIKAVVEQFLTRNDVQENEKKIAKQLLECLTKHEPQDNPDSKDIGKDD